jgi:stearoyl-CoA desaturase (Delta-9 desaturase)
MLQHSFPDDYRSDPAKSAWDPSKWVILSLAKLGFVSGLRYARAEDITASRAYMLARDHHGAHDKAVEEEEWVGPTWTEAEMEAYVKESDACILVIDKYVLDVTRYIDIHVRFSLFPHFGNLLTIVAWRCEAPA